ncbi:glutamate racemase [Sedimentibacter sp. zth1]|uniref:glutamate racemase n=1 Tax=Sedimentibacter sp. zth1 TaxID=2816908 RepID=UPI001A90DFE5|nr:glutamate racemase [Sedimentibacter sp. zth1]QSX05802.1 glutamate racemase [Sedimentibacter sp. zth1]
MNKLKNKIGVFDSGLGGISVLKELVKLMPNEEYIYYGDSLNAPYGIKSKNKILERCLKICDFLIETGVKAIVVACNTATSATIDILRQTYKDIPIIGMEPALKVAAYNKVNNNIIVMATQLTLNEEKFKLLMKMHSDKNTIIKMPCPELVEIVEHNKLDEIELVNNTINNYFKNINLEDIDSIVLGCTHFVFYKYIIKNIVFEKTNIIDGNNGTARHLKNVLRENDLLRNNKNIGNIQYFNSSSDENYIKLSKKLFSI